MRNEVGFLLTSKYRKIHRERERERKRDTFIIYTLYVCFSPQLDPQITIMLRRDAKYYRQFRLSDCRFLIALAFP